MDMCPHGMLLDLSAIGIEEANVPENWESSDNKTWDNMTDRVWEEEKQ